MRRQGCDAEAIYAALININQRRCEPPLEYSELKTIADSIAQYPVQEGTVLAVDRSDDPLMRDELFGPLLPMIEVEDLAMAMEQIRSQPKPLALYLFGGTAAQQQQLLMGTSSGGVCFNDVVMHVGIPDLPFGGVGPSGMGSYHGEAGFRTFSHERSVLRRPFALDLRLRYPPYRLSLDWMRRLLG